MARKKKSGGALMAGAMPMKPRVSASVERAENGYVVNTSGHGPNGFHDKTHVARSHGGAMRIANGHLRSLASGKPKAGAKKRGSRKKSAA